MASMEGTAGREHELKAEGVIEAAQDPNSSVTSDDAQKAMVDHARAAGAAAFTFNPDASPEEKAAQAQEVREEITTRSTIQWLPNADMLRSKLVLGCTERTRPPL
jgi:hypothetical protein